VRPGTPSRLAFHVSRIVIDVGVLLVLGALSLSFVTAEGFHQRSVAGDGLPALFLVLPVFVMTLLPDQSRPLPPALAWPATALAAVALAYSVLKYLDASTLAGTLRGSVGVGARVLVMGAFTVLAGTVLTLVRSLLPSPAVVADTASPDGALPARIPGGAPGPGRAAPAPVSGRPAGAASRTAGTPPPSPAARSASGRAGATAPPAARVPAEPRPPARVPPRPQPSDPDTQPTVPVPRPVQPWWPDDLEDLFS
jgi:hypothetical protein